MKILEIVKTHPKKIIFFSSLSAWGGNFAWKKFQDYKARRIYCHSLQSEANRFIFPKENLRRVTVFLNPSAKKGKAAKWYEKNVEPYLHMSGLLVQKVITEHSGEAKDYMGVLESESTDAILVAGGDGTLMEIATGLLRRQDYQKKYQFIPIGCVPLGEKNTFLTNQVHGTEKDLVRWCYNSVSPLLQQQARRVSVLEIKPRSDGTTPSKMMYSLSGLEWSVGRDVRAYSQEKLWMFGPLRQAWGCIWAPLRGHSAVLRPKVATIRFRPVCSGCANCSRGKTSRTSNSISGGTKFSKWLGMKPAPAAVTANKAESTVEVNENCRVHEINVDSAASITVVNQADHMLLRIRPQPDSMLDLMKACFAWKKQMPYALTEEVAITEQTESGANHVVVKCQWVELTPAAVEAEQYYIDNENLEAKSVEISHLPNALSMYLPAQKL